MIALITFRDIDKMEDITIVAGSLCLESSSSDKGFVVCLVIATTKSHVARALEWILYLKEKL